MEFFRDSHAELRSYEIGGKLWFALEDVLAALELTEGDIVELRSEDISTVNDGIRIISEGGFYYLMIFVSTTPAAKKFADWVMKDVVGSILTKGYYDVREH